MVDISLSIEFATLAGVSVYFPEGRVQDILCKTLYHKAFAQSLAQHKVELGGRTVIDIRRTIQLYLHQALAYHVETHGSGSTRFGLIEVQVSVERVRRLFEHRAFSRRMAVVDAGSIQSCRVLDDLTVGAHEVEAEMEIFQRVGDPAKALAYFQLYPVDVTFVRIILELHDGIFRIQGLVALRIVDKNLGKLVLDLFGEKRSRYYFIRFREPFPPEVFTVRTLVHQVYITHNHRKLEGVELVDVGHFAHLRTGQGSIEAQPEVHIC